jgi:hypothetical protein
MNTIVPFRGTMRPTALNKPAPVIDIAPSDMHNGSWAVLSCFEHSGYCERIIDGILCMDDAIAAAERIANERRLRVGVGLGGGGAA